MSRYLSFDGMCWPEPHDTGEVEWKLRYAPQSLDRADELVAASIIAAYFALVDKTDRERRPITRELQKAYRGDQP